MGCYRLGLVPEPRVPVAIAVAASAAFPPFLSPLTLTLDPEALEQTEGADLYGHNKLRRTVPLSDGGKETLKYPTRPPKVDKVIWPVAQAVENRRVPASIQDHGYGTSDPGRTRPGDRLGSIADAAIVILARCMGAARPSLGIADLAHDLLGDGVGEPVAGGGFIRAGRHEVLWAATPPGTGRPIA